MLELYNFPQSTCSLKVRICLAEKELNWVDHRLISADHDHLKPDYLKLNPNGVVPTLIHDGVPVIESSVILQYLDEAFPDISLMPQDLKEKARLRAWLAYFDLVATPAVRYPSFNQGGLLRKFQNMSEQEFNDLVDRRPLKADLYKKLGQDGFSAEDIDKAIRDIRKTVLRMEEALTNAGPWLMGERYSIADICVAPLIDRMEDLGYANLWELDLPKVTDWLSRMQDRSAYKTAYYPGSRNSQIYPDLKLGKGVKRPLNLAEMG